jgi:curved DNA-binding protein CbpA
LVKVVIGEDVFPSEWHGTDYYTTLGVGQSATAKEIKAEYRWLAKKFHPDFNPDDAKAHNRFLKIQQAYETLSDGEKRKRYDDFLQGGRQPEESVAAPQSSEHQAPKDEPLITAEAQTNSWRAWAGISTVVALLFLLGTIAAVGSGAPSPPQETASSQTISPPPPTVIPSRYSSDDVEACRNFLDWRVDFGGVASPTSQSELRSALNRMELDISSFFYLADDLELLQISNSAKRAAGIAAAVVGEADEATWSMVTTGFEDALGRLSAVCKTVN